MCVWIYSLYVCLCTIYVYCLQREAIRSSVGAGNQIHALWRMLLAPESSQSLEFVF